MYVEEKLKPNLETYGAATLISVFDKDLNINTHAALEEVEIYVWIFK